MDAASQVPRREPPTKRRKTDMEEMVEKVGPVSETRQQHLARHGGGSGRSDCPHCVWYRDGPTWMTA